MTDVKLKRDTDRARRELIRRQLAERESERQRIRDYTDPIKENERRMRQKALIDFFTR